MIEPLSPEEIKMILDIGATIEDLSTIGKMKDFYAINLFSLKNTILAYQSGNRQLFLYLLIYTLVLESFRNPAIEIETRKQICEICILFFSKFYVQTPLITNKDKENNQEDQENENKDRESQSSQVTQNRSKYSDGVNFGPSKFLIKFIHTMIGLRFVLEHHPEYLGIDRLTTHILENYFGQNRLNCKGDNRLNKVLHFFIEGAFDYQLVQEFGLGDKINGRDNIGGTRYDPNKWKVTFAKTINTQDFVNSLYEYGTNESEEIDEKLIEQKVEYYMDIIQMFYKDLDEANAYKPLLYEPSEVSGKSIQIRYFSKKQ